MRSVLLFSALLVAQLCAEATFAGSFRDKDWSVVLRDTCGLPQASSISQVSQDGDRKLRVTLKPGDKGKCSIDAQARHSAPYWERAEVTQATRLELGARYRITAEVTLLQGFTGEREAFLQIHGWNTRCKKAYPPAMLKFDKGQLRIETLRGVSALSSGRHRNALKHTIAVKGLYGKPVRFALDLDMSTKPGRLSVSLNEQQIVSGAPVDYARCAVPYLKLGIYRPGGKGSETSAALFDDVTITSLK